MADARLSDLLEHYHLKEDDVNKELEIQDIEAISYSCKSKWKYLLIRLGLKEMDFADAENLKTDQEKRSQNLTNWKQKKGSDATFKRLIIAQLEIECRDDAENVCKILQDTLNTTQDTEPTGKVAVRNFGRLSTPDSLVILSASLPVDRLFQVRLCTSTYCLLAQNLT